MQFNFKFYGEINVKPFVSLIDELNWDEYKFRQENYAVHAQTKTVPLIWDEHLNKIQFWKNYYLISNELIILQYWLKIVLGDGLIKTAILIKLPKGNSIPRHYDKGKHFIECNRIHIPIITNAECIFEIDNERRNLKVGEVWEINNNAKPHAVFNNGDSDRVHLLLDYYKIK